MLVIDKFKVRQRELLFYKFSEFVLYRLGPMTNEDNELIDCPSDATAWNLSVVALEFSF